MNTPSVIKSKTHDEKKAMAYLRKNNILALATSSLSGEPHAASVVFSIDRDFNFYFLTTGHTAKCQNIRENNKVAFTVGFGPEPITVQGGGVATLLSDSETVSAGYNLKNDTHPWPILRLSQNDICAFRITPIWLVMLDLGDAAAEHVDGEFHKII